MVKFSFLSLRNDRIWLKIFLEEYGFGKYFCQEFPVIFGNKPTNEISKFEKILNEKSKNQMKWVEVAHYVRKIILKFSRRISPS